MKFIKAGKKGFTLIELLTVIAIIGILASIIMVSLKSAQSKGRDAKRVADIRTIQLALEEYYNDNGAYPTSISNSALANYLPSVPTDPSTNVSYFYTVYDLTSAGSSNCTTHPIVKYHLAAAMESTASTNSALNQDADWNGDPGAATYTKCSTGGSGPSGGAVFDGLTSNCVGTTEVSASADGCYDETN
ncbi:MAG: prepilin-type N-terminal cleavage/methylation domain-containing protein [Minisyncoccia bacterium]|jgi:type II secretion system protein G